MNLVLECGEIVGVVVPCVLAKGGFHLDLTFNALNAGQSCHRSEDLVLI